MSFNCSVCGSENKVYSKRGICSICYQRQYRKDNKEKTSKYNKQYRLKNPERIRIIQRKQDKRRSKVRTVKKYIKYHTDEDFRKRRVASSKRSRDNRKEKISEYKKQYYIDNKERILAMDFIRRNT